MNLIPTGFPGKSMKGGCAESDIDKIDQGVELFLYISVGDCQNILVQLFSKMLDSCIRENWI